MSVYTTGELAKLCEVSVRTVQFYDTKDILKPKDITEGGRRLYSDDDLKKLRLICMLKSLGLSLGSIKDILESQAPSKVLQLLLDQQEKQINSDIKDKQKQIKAIQVIKDSIQNINIIPVNLINDIENIMKNKNKLRKIYMTMGILSALGTSIQVIAIIFWTEYNIWWPFVITMPIVILATIISVKIYYKNTAYICAQCNSVFKPKLKQFFWANHTPKTRKLTCPNCEHTGYCVEIASED